MPKSKIIFEIYENVYLKLFIRIKRLHNYHHRQTYFWYPGMVLISRLCKLWLATDIEAREHKTWLAALCHFHR